MGQKSSLETASQLGNIALVAGARTPVPFRTRVIRATQREQSRKDEMSVSVAVRSCQNSLRVTHSIDDISSFMKLSCVGVSHRAFFRSASAGSPRSC